MDHDRVEDLHWWGVESDKMGQEFWEGRGLCFFPFRKGLSLPVKQQQPNKSETNVITNSRLWHPSDPKHVLIISPWLPVGVDVISTHIPIGRTSIQTVASNHSDTGLRGLEWSNKSNEGIQFESPCSHFYTALLSTDEYLSCIRHSPC